MFRVNECGKPAGPKTRLMPASLNLCWLEPAYNFASCHTLLLSACKAPAFSLCLLRLSKQGDNAGFGDFLDPDRFEQAGNGQQFAGVTGYLDSVMLQPDVHYFTTKNIDNS